jgi:hypothetical protein
VTLGGAALGESATLGEELQPYRQRRIGRPFPAISRNSYPPEQKHGIFASVRGDHRDPYKVLEGGRP